MSSRRRDPLTLTPQDVRRLAISRQQLAGAPPAPDGEGLMQVMRAIRCLQLDPISAVARSPLLVLWSRLGRYSPELLQQALWQDRVLFEYWAHAASIVLVEDWPLHRWRMAHRRNGGWSPRTRQWLDEKDSLRRQILERLKHEGPLASSDFAGDDACEEWHSGGWTNLRSVNQLLGCLWAEGQVLVAGRKGRTRLWDLPPRCLPPDFVDEALAEEEVVAQAVQLSLRALGVGTARHIREHFTRGRYPGLEQAIERLLRQGLLLPVRIIDGDDAWPGAWYMHAAEAPLLQRLQEGDWQPRTTLLSPFDNLICDRARTELLFDFHYRLEIYVPAGKRQYGYYVMPILHGDRLVGRIDPRYDQKSGQLVINAVFAEPHAAADQSAAHGTARAVRELAEFMGAQEVVYQGPAPDTWQGALH